VGGSERAAPSWDTVSGVTMTDLDSDSPDAGAGGDGGAGEGFLAPRRRFEVHLANFEGPFDLLLQLISKHKLDVTEVALSQVTDEFLAYTKAMGSNWDLGQTTEFLLVAATLLDLKAARLLPAAEVEDEDDLALLEARDLLFARLLQYRAYKQVAALFAELEARAAHRFPRSVALEQRYSDALPELTLPSPDRFARLAVKALTPKVPPLVSLEHLHNPKVSVREHAMLISERLRRTGAATFRTLVADCEITLEVVARFLALLELYREGMVMFEQVTPLGELHVRWTGGDRVVELRDEYGQDQDGPEKDEEEPGDE
jgi:segregation and condensation protein A